MRTLFRLGFASATLAASLAAAPSPASWNLGVHTTIGYDDNVYGVDTGPLANIDSLFATLSARVAATPAKGVALAYAPVATRYFDAGREDHIKHVLSASWKQQAGTVSWRAATDLTYVSGDGEGTDYGAGHGSAFSTAIPRERREQFQNRTELSLRHDSSPGFVRALGRLAYWDMRTTSVAGCNYVDRYDTQGGFDLGRIFAKGKGPELYLGYRRGYQYQDRDANPASPRHSSNHYDRLVLGTDARLAPSLKLVGEFGGSRHTFSADPAIYAGPRRENDVFADLSLIWTPTTRDEVQFKTSSSRTLSTTGVNNFYFTQHQITWKRAYTGDWSTSLLARAMDADYMPALRHDAVYGLLASATKGLGHHWSATLSCQLDRGRELHPAITGAASTAREFERHIVSLALSWKK